MANATPSRKTIQSETRGIEESVHIVATVASFVAIGLLALGSGGCSWRCDCNFFRCNRQGDLPTEQWFETTGYGGELEMSPARQESERGGNTTSTRRHTCPGWSVKVEHKLADFHRAQEEILWPVCRRQKKRYWRQCARTVLALVSLHEKSTEKSVLMIDRHGNLQSRQRLLL